MDDTSITIVAIVVFMLVAVIYLLTIISKFSKGDL